MSVLLHKPPMEAQGSMNIPNSNLSNPVLTKEPKEEPHISTMLDQLPTDLEKNLYRKSETSAMSQLYCGPYQEFSFNVKRLEETEMIGGIYFALADLDLITHFKIKKQTVIRFIVSLKDAYRPLPYHNWQHGCSVYHFAYLFIKKLRLLERQYFTTIQAFAMLVSALCHDVDHPGRNNRFEISTNSDIYKLYNIQDSVLERHHLSVAMKILGRDECNILAHLSPVELTEFNELLSWNILATDIAKYLQSRDYNFKILRSFKKENKDHSYALLSLLMTACDVSDCVKAWDDSLVSAQSLLTEFFEQGDLEKEMGMTPMALMDRKRADIPEVEFKFLIGIVEPVYSALAEKFPELQPCLDAVKKSERYWVYSTVVFDAHAELEDKLAILRWPHMRESTLIKLLKDTSNMRKVSEFFKRKSSRSMDMTSLAFFSKPITEPEIDFKRVFSSDKLVRRRDDMTLIVPENPKTKKRSSWLCCRRKPQQKLPQTPTTVLFPYFDSLETLEKKYAT